MSTFQNIFDMQTLVDSILELVIMIALACVSIILFSTTIFRSYDSDRSNKCSEPNTTSSKKPLNQYNSKEWSKSDASEPEQKFVHVFNGMSLAFSEVVWAEAMAHHMLLGKHITIPLHCSSQTTSFEPSSLTEIFRFDEHVRAAQRHNPGFKIIVCTQRSLAVQSKAIFLMGCHLIMSQEFSAKEAIDNLGGLPESRLPTEDNELSLSCCWTALYRAKALNWIDFGDIFDIGVEDTSRIFIEEYIHYAE
jgi:hypothetical protein